MAPPRSAPSGSRLASSFWGRECDNWGSFGAQVWITICENGPNERRISQPVLGISSILGPTSRLPRFCHFTVQVCKSHQAQASRRQTLTDDRRAVRLTHAATANARSKQTANAQRAARRTLTVSASPGALVIMWHVPCCAHVRPRARHRRPTSQHRRARLALRSSDEPPRGSPPAPPSPSPPTPLRHIANRPSRGGLELGCGCGLRGGCGVGVVVVRLGLRAWALGLRA